MEDAPIADRVQTALAAVMRSPTPEGLWTLRAELLEAGLPDDATAWSAIDRFREYLDELSTRTTSREYSELASKLDISAVGGVVVEQLLDSDEPEDLAYRLLAGLFSEGLMILATRQHVRAWEGELGAVYRDAAWALYGELWRWTRELKPDLPARERRALLDRLLLPVHAAETSGFGKAIVLGALFQVLVAGTVRESFGKHGAR